MRPNRLFALLALCVIVTIVSCNQTKESPAASAQSQDAKKADLAKSFYPMMEKGDWGGIEKIIASNFTDHSAWMPPAGVSGRDSAMTALKSWKEGFPDMKIEVLHTAVDGNMVFVHFHFTGSNNGPLMGMPATNKKVDYTGVDLVQVSDSLVTAHWDYGDNVTYLKQMGLMQ